MLPVIVTYEDRVDAIPGIALLARSLHKHEQSLSLLVYSPLKCVASALRDASNVRIIYTSDLLGRGWNAKPTIMLRALSLYEHVLWLDTDIIIIGNLRRLLSRYDADAIVVGQEFRGSARAGSSIRVAAFELESGRALPYSINSGSVLVARHHRKLLEKWSMLTSTDRYISAQSRPIRERPTAFVGDQDALWAILASTDFLDTKVDYFRVGSDMIQHCGANGYHALDRLAFNREPAFVHMLGRYKPWSFIETPNARRNLSKYLHMVCYELSPFFEAAQPFATDLGCPSWLRRRTIWAKVFNAAFFGNVALRGLPLALLAWSADRCGRKPLL